MYTPHIHQEVILVGRLPFASLCGFTWVPGLDKLFLGSFEFAINQIIYQEEKETGPGSLIYQ